MGAAPSEGVAGPGRREIRDGTPPSRGTATPNTPSRSPPGTEDGVLGANSPQLRHRRPRRGRAATGQWKGQRRRRASRGWRADGPAEGGGRMGEQRVPGSNGHRARRARAPTPTGHDVHVRSRHFPRPPPTPPRPWGIASSCVGPHRHLLDVVGVGGFAGDQMEIRRTPLKREPGGNPGLPRSGIRKRQATGDPAITGIRALASRLGSVAR